MYENNTDNSMNGCSPTPPSTLQPQIQPAMGPSPVSSIQRSSDPKKVHFNLTKEGHIDSVGGTYNPIFRSNIYEARNDEVGLTVLNLKQPISIEIESHHPISTSLQQPLKNMDFSY